MDLQTHHYGKIKFDCFLLKIFSFSILIQNQTKILELMKP